LTVVPIRLSLNAETLCDSLLNALSREKIKINFVAYCRNVGSPVGGTKLVWLRRGFDIRLRL
jgi:hypothetical protein